MNSTVTEELISFPCGDINLSGILTYSNDHAPAYAALICAPHPNFAGNMENNLVVALATAFASRAMTLRFNYRGIGTSEIKLPDDQSVFDYWDAIEQSRNYADPLADITAAAAALNDASHNLPLVILGYSFGSIVGAISGMQLPNVRAMAGIAPPLAMYPFDFLAHCNIPCLLLSGADDFVFSASESERLKAVWSANVQQLVLPEQDHFFRDSEGTICARIRTFIETGANL